MESLYKLEQLRLKAQKRHYKKEEELEKQIAVLEAKKKRMRYPHILDYLNKLGKACLPKIKGAIGFKVYGPFGLGNECSIYFHSKQKDKSGDNKTLAGATFTRYGDGYGLKDYSKNTGRFAKGSIGELNGMNNPTIEITEKMTLDWFIKFAKKGWSK